MHLSQFSSLSNTPLKSVVVVLVLVCTISSGWAALVAEGDALIDDGIEVAMTGEGGTLTLTAPTALRGSGIFVAGAEQSTGRVIVDGGSYEVIEPSGGNGPYGLLIGEAGRGVLKVINGGQVASSAYLLITVGRSPASTGSIEIAGPFSQLYLPQGTMQIGVDSHGSFSVEDGATATLGTAYLGADGESRITGSGTVSVRGPGSRLNVSSEVAIGSGALTISDGGLLRSGNRNRGFANIVGFQHPGLVIVEGAGSEWQHAGRVSIFNGTQIVRDGARASSDVLSIGSPGWESAPNSLLLVDGLGSQVSTGTLAVGAGSRAEMLVHNGASAISGHVDVGNHGHAATIEIKGLGSRWTVEHLEIGDYGRLEIDDGALLGPLNPFSRSIVVHNRGLIRGSGMIQHAVENTDWGRIDVGHGQRLVLGGLRNQSQAHVHVVEGEIEFRSSFLNNQQASISLLNSTLRTPPGQPLNGVALNLGLISAIGDNIIYGDLVNVQQGSIQLSGNGRTVFHGDVVNESEITVTEGSSVAFLGTYYGIGTQGSGTVTFEREVFSRGGPTEMVFFGDVLLGNFSQLNIEVGQGAHDRLDIAGSASIGGELVLNALSPLEGDTVLEIVTADSIVGTFKTVPQVGQDLGFGVVFDGISYGADSVEISLLQQSADFNGDSSIDGVDLGIWQGGYALIGGATLADGDAQRDTDVDGSDFLAWQRDWQAPEPVAAGLAVPEPTTALITTVVLATLLGSWRRSSKTW